MTDIDVSPRRAQRSEVPSKGDLRERELLDAAGRLLAEGTFGAASVSEIATEAGLSRAAFYFYFASKQALLATLLDDAVAAFNRQIHDVVNDDFASPAEALRATVRAAAELWWDHRAVLKASVELGTAIPEVYERASANFALVGAPTLELLQRHGTVPEASDRAAATALVTALMLMSERNFFDLMRGKPTAGERDALTSTLQTIWLRSFGLAD